VAFSAVLDANVLYPFSLRDTLLRLAELELFTPLWSTRILEEMRRTLVEHRITAEQADRIKEAMRQAFEEAEVDPDEIERLEPAMTNDPKDRHVVAAAVAADSGLIVTFDLDDFPVAACEPVGVEAIHRDAGRQALSASARRQRVDRSWLRWTASELATLLSRVAMGILVRGQARGRLRVRKAGR
jgi:predicted nucleic acid-binding protein